MSQALQRMSARPLVAPGYLWSREAGNVFLLGLGGSSAGAGTRSVFCTCHGPARALRMDHWILNRTRKCSSLRGGKELPWLALLRSGFARPVPRRSMHLLHDKVSSLPGPSSHRLRQRPATELRTPGPAVQSGN